MADDQKHEQQKQEQANLLFDLFKEQTGALVESTKAIKALSLQIGGQPGVGPDDEGGVPGLLDRLADLEESNASLQEAVDSLDGRVAGLNYKVSMVDYVLDQLADVIQGKADASPPVPGRSATLDDAVRAKRDYDKKVEDELVAEAEAAAQETPLDTAGGDAVAPSAPQAKPLMLSNAKRPPAPVMRDLPPLPVAPAKPV